MVSGADVNFRKITASLNKSCVLNQTICTLKLIVVEFAGKNTGDGSREQMVISDCYEMRAADLVTIGEKTKLMKQ